MATMWDSTVRNTFADRSARLAADTKPGWGKMNAAAMMAHLNDSYRMCLGELPVKSKNLFLRYTPIRQLIIFALPFPKGAPNPREGIREKISVITSSRPRRGQRSQCPGFRTSPCIFGVRPLHPQDSEPATT